MFFSDPNNVGWCHLGSLMLGKRLQAQTLWKLSFSDRLPYAEDGSEKLCQPEESSTCEINNMSQLLTTLLTSKHCLYLFVIICGFT